MDGGIGRQEAFLKKGEDVVGGCRAKGRKLLLGPEHQVFVLLMAAAEQVLHQVQPQPNGQRGDHGGELFQGNGAGAQKAAGRLTAEPAGVQQAVQGGFDQQLVLLALRQHQKMVGHFILRAGRVRSAGRLAAAKLVEPCYQRSKVNALSWPGRVQECFDFIRDGSRAWDFRHEKTNRLQDPTCRLESLILI